MRIFALWGASGGRAADSKTLGLSYTEIITLHSLAPDLKPFCRSDYGSGLSQEEVHYSVTRLKGPMVPERGRICGGCSRGFGIKPGRIVEASIQTPPRSGTWSEPDSPGGEDGVAIAMLMNELIDCTYICEWAGGVGWYTCTEDRMVGISGSWYTSRLILQFLFDILSDRASFGSPSRRDQPVMPR